MDFTGLSIQEVSNKIQQYWKAIRQPSCHFPPMVKFTLSDTTYQVPGIFDTIEGEYVYIEGGELVVVKNADWRRILTPNINNVDLERVVTIKTSIFGRAEIVGLDLETQKMVTIYKPSADHQSPSTAVKDIQVTIPKNIGSLQVCYYIPSGAEYSLVVGEFEEIVITRDVPHDAEAEITYQRNDTASLIHSRLDPPLDLGVKEIAKDFLDYMFFLRGVYAHVQFNIYQRHNIRLDEYTLLSSTRISFESMEIKKDLTYFRAFGADFNAMAKSKGSIKYDIPAHEVEDVKTLKYNRLALENRGEYTVTLGDYNDTVTAYMYHPQVNLDGAEMILGSPEHKFQTQELRENNRVTYFFQAAEDVDVSFKLKMKVRVTGNFANDEPIDPVVGIRMYDPNVPDVFVYYWKQSIPYVRDTPGGQPVYELELNEELGKDINESNEGFPTIKKGYRVSFVLEARADRNTSVRSLFAIEDFEEFSIFYNTKAETVNRIRIINPTFLFQKLVNLMSAYGKYEARIDWRDDDYLLRLCAAESVRGYENDIVHTSFSDFLKWMRTLGYDLAYDEDTKVVRFVPVEAGFPRDVVAAEIPSKNIGTMDIEGYEQFNYTGVNVGYKKIDYDSANGRFEVNGTFDYTTGYVSVRPNILDLVSPYRADAIGFELLAFERARPNADQNADNDVFCLALKDVGSHYEVWDKKMLKVSSQTELFNEPLTPPNLVRMNEAKIGIISSKLTFTATTSNRESVVVDKSEDTKQDLYVDIPITKKLFEPYTYTVYSRYLDRLPGKDVRNGLVRFQWQGKTYEGYIRIVEKDYIAEDRVKWELHAYQPK